jgi:hypothetical protein
MQGPHNQQNLLMAVAAARLAGIEPEAIATAIRSFPGVPHRLEHLGQWQGIRFVNDSKATNYDAAEVGLASVEAPVVLLAGWPVVERSARAVVDDGRRAVDAGAAGHIFNLGHGVLPGTDPGLLTDLVSLVHSL